MLLEFEMGQSVVHQKYKLSVVSGGKLVLPRASNRSCCGKSVTLLTRDETCVVVPFNNQIKVYSLETSQCVKTLKFANNAVLSRLFLGADAASICDLTLGDLTLAEDGTADGAHSDDTFDFSVITSAGDVVVLNYKGKLADEPKVIQLGTLQPNEQVVKLFRFGGRVSVLTSEAETSATYTYRIYSYDNSERKLSERKRFEHVLLSAWSSNDKFLCLLAKGQNSKKVLYLEDIHDQIDSKTLPLPSIASASASSNAHFATVMALDHQGSQLAVGYASGVINVINLTDQSTRLLKWHIDSVLSLCFTSDGTYLLSGGWEKVLSFWQLSTNLQQFLPRLNGVVVDCNILHDKFYSLGLQFADNQSSSDYQLLLLNSTDLKSRIAISGPLCVFQTAVRDVVYPVSAVSSKASASSADLQKANKKQQRKLLKRRRQDFSSVFEIQPSTKHLYFPHTSAVQIFDFYKNEQIHYQYLASGLNNSMGKVRSELNLKDPVIADVKFTKDGNWMISYEVEYPPEGLLSSNDFSHVLKFWRMSGSGEWELQTKVLSPHGLKTPITSILVAPRSVNNSLGCLTSDNNGGLKYWSFDEVLNNWALSKVAVPSVNHFSNSVELAWSLDGSLIFHAFDDKVTVIEFAAFKKFYEDSAKALNEFTMDSAIQSIMLVNDSNLIVATQTSLNSINLLLGVVESSFDLYPFVNGVYKNGHASRLISCDEKNGRVALVVNHKVLDAEGRPTLNYASHVLVFNSDLSQKLGAFEHDEYISCIRWNFDTDFIFLDTKNRLGVVSTTTSPEMLDEVDKEGALDQLASNEFEIELQKLTRAQKAQGLEPETDEKEEALLDFINGDKSGKLINMNSFTSMFENIENVQMDTLFDRVMKVIT